MTRRHVIRAFLNGGSVCSSKTCCPGVVRNGALWQSYHQRPWYYGNVLRVSYQCTSSRIDVNRMFTIIAYTICHVLPCVSLLATGRTKQCLTDLQSLASEYQGHHSFRTVSTTIHNVMQLMMFCTSIIWHACTLTLVLRPTTKLLGL